MGFSTVGNRKGRPTHGLCHLSEYSVYKAAKKRCQNPNCLHYHRYGGRGIEFRFLSFPEFLAAIGPRPDAQHSIDRIDNDGHYEVGNVRWATHKEQCKNRIQNTWSKGATNPKARLKEEQVLEIRRRWKAGDNYRLLAREFGVSESCVQFVIHRRSWQFLEAA